MKQPYALQEVKDTLRSMALDIEFLLISVIQGMVLQMLAASAVPVFGEFRVEYWCYVVSAFILILIFWSQSILHAWSFIDWPIDLIHSFLYFLASFVEVITFAHITQPLKWFIFGFLFLLVTGILYVYDLSMIKKRISLFKQSPSHKRLYDHVYKRQIRELQFLVPSALVFNIIASWLIYTQRTFFITKHYHILLGVTQALFSLILLLISVQTFKTRLRLITDTYVNPD